MEFRAPAKSPRVDARVEHQPFGDPQTPDPLEATPKICAPELRDKLHELVQDEVETPREFARDFATFPRQLSPAEPSAREARTPSLTVEPSSQPERQQRVPTHLRRPPGLASQAPATVVVSFGTIGHPTRCREACKYRGRKGGCALGSRCTRCHLCNWKRPEVARPDRDEKQAALAVLPPLPPPPLHEVCSYDWNSRRAEVPPLPPPQEVRLDDWRCQRAEVARTARDERQELALSDALPPPPPPHEVRLYDWRSQRAEVVRPAWDELPSPGIAQKPRPGADQPAYVSLGDLRAPKAASVGARPGADSSLQRYVGSQACPSVGSFGHPRACCWPCKYHTKPRGCRLGSSCERCHLCRWTRSQEQTRQALEARGLAAGGL